MTQSPQGHRAFPIVLVVLAVLAGIIGVWLGQQVFRNAAPLQLKGGTVLPQPKPVSAFELMDHHRRPFGLDQLRGHWTFAFFGYTNCPDVCPTTLKLLDDVAQKLSAQAGILDDTQFLFVSVDPQRDTPERLADYVAYFNEDFIGATGEPDAIDKLTRQLGLLYMRAEGSSEEPSDEGYLIDHSASIVLLDKQGRMTALFSQFPHDAEAIARDYLKIRDRYGS